MSEGSIPAEPPPRIHRLFWWKEALIVLGFYLAYSWTRNRFGSNQIAADGVPEAAFHNAERVIQLETWLGTFHEESIQEHFLSQTWFIQFWNVYYGTAHFFVTLAVFALLFVKRADVFPQWRNTLAAMTALAIIGFAFFPLMPPRLLDQPCPSLDNNEYGGACVASDFREGDIKTFTGDNGFGFVDTLSEYGGPWRFDSDEVASISNQYAAMPSLHIGWATWCALAVWPLLRRRWTKVAVLLYPVATLFCIIVTANHFWLDGVGGLVVFTVGALIGWGMHRWNQNRLDRQAMLDAMLAERPGYPKRDTRLGSLAYDIVDDVSGENYHPPRRTERRPTKPADTPIESTAETPTGKPAETPTETPADDPAHDPAE